MEAMEFDNYSSQNNLKREIREINKKINIISQLLKRKSVCVVVIKDKLITVY